MEPIEQFWSIGAEATERVGESFNAPDVVSFGERLLELIARHPDKRSEFTQAFLEALGKPEAYDPWLIQFCMHALRWPEAKERFESLSREAIAKDNWNRIPTLQHILEAFEDNWEDANDFYGEYFSKKRT